MRSPYRFALAGVAAAALLAAGCSSSSSSSLGEFLGQPAVNWATDTSASAGGGMSALIAAAKKEGTLNVIALPPTWANYGTIISTFEKDYGIKVNSANPDGSSQDEVNAVKQENGTAAAPDVLDIGMAVATANTNLFAPYKVSTWSDIPAAQKSSAALWYQDYGGYMSIGYSSKFGHNHVDEPAARVEVQERGGAEREPDGGQRRAQRRHASQPGAGRIARRHRRRRELLPASSRRPATSRRIRRPAPRSRRARPRSCSTGITSTCPAT